MLAVSLLALNAAAAPMAPAGAPSQLLVLGMHHAGTSIVANLTMMMGAFGGAHDELLLHPDNPLKFWERRDVVALDERRLVEGMVDEVNSRYEVPDWVAYGFDGSKATAKVHEREPAKAIVEKLNAQRPWVTKDPRMCLVADEWMPLLDAPMCILVHRDPLSVADSMMIYSHNVSLAEWASVYENYYHRAIKACEGVSARRRPARARTRAARARLWGRGGGGSRAQGGRGRGGWGWGALPACPRANRPPARSHLPAAGPL